MRLLIDTDVLIDLAIDREPFAMQVAAAMAVGADAIVTRNLKDYRSSPVPAREPVAVLSSLG